jgi:hypothetical protein
LQSQKQAYEIEVPIFMRLTQEQVLKNKDGGLFAFKMEFS